MGSLSGMKHFILIPLILLVGCRPLPIAEVKPDFTSDAELIAWKDGPADKFKGKVFRVKAFFGGDELRKEKDKAGFWYRAGTLGGGPEIQFVVLFPKELEVPNVTHHESAILEFESTTGELKAGNVAKFISR
jgi:hypothetical protein